MRKSIGGLLAFCILLTSCEPAPSVKKEIPAVPVIAVKPDIKDISLYVESVGLLEPSFFVEIRPQISGIIDKILVKEGANVKAGMPLIHIDAQAFEIKVNEAKAQLEMDQAAFEVTKKTWDRFYSLAQKDLVAQTEWDEMDGQLAKAKAVLAVDRARLDAAMLDYERCTLRAPADGRVGRLMIHPGTLVSREQSVALATLSKNDPLIVNFTITEKEFEKLSKEKSLIFEAEGLCNKKCRISGEITFFDTSFDLNSGLLSVRGELKNENNSFFIGQSVKVRVPIATLSKVLVIPQKAIKYSQEGPYIYVVSKENKVELRQLILGEEEGEDVVVSEGMTSEEQIIISGHGRLSPGLKVEMQL
jgi:multidrug efflux system membrane fusion protein